MLNIDTAMIEVTRRCNMACDHCLRGEPQKKDIPDSMIDTFFEKVGSGIINNLTITGGEPSLVPEKIEKIIEAAKRNGTDIENFYIVTNGKQVTDAFLMAVMRLHCYCSDNEYSGLQYSNDYYHDPIITDNVKRLEVFKFASPRNTEDSAPEMGTYEIIEGRAKENGIGVREETGIGSRWFDLEDYIYDGDDSIREMHIYLNCKGNIICGCDWSYESQDRKANKVCHVSKLSIEAVKSYLMQFEGKAQAA